MAFQNHSDIEVLFATLFGGLVAIIRLFATSGYPFLSNAAAPYVPLEYVFVFISAFLYIHGWFGKPRIALILATFVAVAFYIVATGAML